MDLEYFYCSHCGYESFDTYVAFSRTCANGDFCYCPECNEESSVVKE